jgi:hypothetical protein
MIALDENRIAAGDQQSGGRVAREVFVDRVRLPLVLVAHGRLGQRAVERRRHRSSPDHPALEDLVVVAEHADEEGNAIDSLDRIALARTVLVGVRAVGSEPGPSAG